MLSGGINMKLKSKLIYLGLLIFITLLLCSYSKNNIRTVKGYILIYGNEPETFIGIKTTEKEEYKIIAPDEVEAELRKAQGKLIEITGIVVPPEEGKLEFQSLKNGRIEVSEWSIVK